MKKLIYLIICSVLLAGCGNVKPDTEDTKPVLEKPKTDSVKPKEVLSETVFGIITEINENTLKVKTDNELLSIPRGYEAGGDLGRSIILTYENHILVSRELIGEPYEAVMAPIIRNMTLEERVGQMFLVRTPVYKKTESITKYFPGGYIFFARDFINSDPSSFKTQISEFNKASKLPMLMAVDEEGGDIVRISKYKAFREAPFLSPKDIYESAGLEGIKKDTQEKCLFLKDLGINVNLAPVCDIAYSEEDYIYNRTLGKGADETAKYTSEVVTQMRENQIGSVLKHFPGYGRNVDTHKGIAVDDRPYTELMGENMLPFISGISSGCDAVLVSHNIITAVDENKPASLSPECHRILRYDLGFNGVIMTDDIAMDAISKYTDVESPSVEAVLSGNDMIICTDFEKEIPAVIEAVKNGTIPEEAIDKAVTRILVWKTALGLYEPTTLSIERSNL